MALFPFASQAQSAKPVIGLDVDAGVALPLHNDLREAFTAGLNISAGPVITLADRRLLVQPLGGIKWYFKEIKQVNSLTEHFRTWKAGLTVLYEVYNSRDFHIAPFIRADYNWCSNYFSETYHYNVYNNASSVAVSDTYLKGNGLSFDIGIRMQRKNWYFKIDHEFFTSSLRVNQAFREEAMNQGFWVPATQTYVLNSLNLSFGYHLKSFK